eukprot:COSAG06_NODE_561_length_14287_cov_13.422047_8_plen_71_part_00
MPPASPPRFRATAACSSAERGRNWPEIFFNIRLTLTEFESVCHPSGVRAVSNSPLKTHAVSWLGTPEQSY